MDNGSPFGGNDNFMMLMLIMMMSGQGGLLGMEA